MPATRNCPTRSVAAVSPMLAKRARMFSPNNTSESLHVCLEGFGCVVRAEHPGSFCQHWTDGRDAARRTVACRGHISIRHRRSAISDRNRFWIVSAAVQYRMGSDTPGWLVKTAYVDC